MPPKPKFSKEQIIEAAFQIAKSEGLESISIRKVADKIGSSIAPLYVNFKHVEDLKRAVVKRIAAISKEMVQAENTGHPFYDIGLASLRFANEYSEIYKDFVLKPTSYMDEFDQEMGSDLIEMMKEDADLDGLNEEELKDLFLKMRVFQAGLGVMIANRLLAFDEKNLIHMLESTATALIAAKQ
ncbi:TetR/AcrR family transcriptional regulator [Alkalihalophilus lindianensis]|uniref:TetR/AcrR family transcriptional regulator n=1 Tax=Alkalihalophilus lindianensis TaxID=1630542 RepID=A0ABU3X4M9_9BACI|nr:TetR/AcrR family transcriptional regulator [Alkalihalophilus lindianensis]MDV2682845.1 TetR/AcrR family transcriptional regulator [Alkalihalophilus lindianensis]